MTELAKPLAKPIPSITPEMDPFYAAARREELVAQKCARCGRLRFPAHPRCSNCLSTEATWTRLSGRGEVYSFNIMHQVYHPGFAAEIPYAVVVVKLEEGVKMISNVVGIKPHELKCGMPVEVIFERLSDEITLPKFRVRAS